MHQKVLSLNRLFNTVKYLRLIQVFYLLRYRLFKPSRVSISIKGVFLDVVLTEFPEKKKSLWVKEYTFDFSFLNLKKTFPKDTMNWSYGDYGMLWTYNLNYFDWLNQIGISKEHGLKTLRCFYGSSADENPIILHPYPTSLRIMNTAKFVAKWAIKEDWLYQELVSDLVFLSGRLEYHLMANHLLENAFALYTGGLITNQYDITKKGKQILLRELKEQVLNDGMHYERSPMYHLIILERLLDALNFAKSTDDDLEFTLKSYAVRMTGLAMTWRDLDRIPMMQDSAYDIALSVTEILKYSKSLLGDDYPIRPAEFKDSGYRRLNAGSFCLFANVGSIRPAYQPGHAHADELNFELFHKGLPIIVDTGVSTYEKNDRRFIERSTSSHNCLVLDGNSSDVWSGFRVGKRATIKIGLDDDLKLTATHDGFVRLTSRTFDSSVTGQISITDKLQYQSTSKGPSAKGYLHLHPDVHLDQLDKATFLINKQIEVTILSKDGNPSIIEFENFSYAKGYNSLVVATVISYSVFEQTIIQIREAN